MMVAMVALPSHELLATLIIGSPAEEQTIRTDPLQGPISSNSELKLQITTKITYEKQRDT
jgi:hypothetical protein